MGVTRRDSGSVGLLPSQTGRDASVPGTFKMSAALPPKKRKENRRSEEVCIGEEDSGAPPVTGNTKVDGDHEQEGLDMKRSLHHQAPSLPPVTPQDLQLHLQLLLWKNSSLPPLPRLPLALPGIPP